MPNGGIGISTLKPLSITAETTEDLRLQLNYILDKMWSILDNVTGSTSKFTQVRYSLITEETPEFLKSYDDTGKLIGIDLLSCIGWLYACVKGLMAKRLKLLRLKKLE